MRGWGVTCNVVIVKDRVGPTIEQGLWFLLVWLLGPVYFEPHAKIFFFFFLNLCPRNGCKAYIC